MKLTQKMVLLLSLFCNTALPQGLTLTPANSTISLDIDGVVLEIPKSQWPVIAFNGTELVHSLQDMKDLSKTFWYMYKSFTTKGNSIYSLCDAQGNTINGLTAQMLTIGMRHKEATRFIAPLLAIIEQSRRLNKEVIKMIQDTKLPIIWTTNKDSLSYQRAAEKHGLNTIAIAAIVTKQPLSQEVLEFAQRADTPESYRKLVEQYQNDKETDTISFAPGKKPSAEYYQHVEKVIGSEKNIIFIDNKKKNIAGFIKALPSSDTAQRIGIHFKNAAHLKSELNKLGLKIKPLNVPLRLF